MFSAIPLLALLLIAYNAAMSTIDINVLLAAEMFGLSLPSGATWSLTMHDLFITCGIVVLYMEIIKSTKTGIASILDHSLSALVFIIFLVQFLITPGCGTSTFFILMLMALLDLISGFTISIISARRDFAIGAN